MGLKLFIPCFLDQCAPQVASAMTGLLARPGVAWEYPAEQTCCGQFAWTAGDPATARRRMRHFLRVFAGAETILCPSAPCTHMVRHCYPQLAEGRREQRAVLAALAARVMELSEWLAGWGPLPGPPHSTAPWSRRFLQNPATGGPGLRPGGPVAGAGIGGAPDFFLLYLLRLWGNLRPAAPRTLPPDRRWPTWPWCRPPALRGWCLFISCLLHLQGLGRAAGRDLKFYHLAEILTWPENPA